MKKAMIEVWFEESNDFLTLVVPMDQVEEAINLMQGYADHTEGTQMPDLLDLLESQEIDASVFEWDYEVYELPEDLIIPASGKYH